MSIPSPTVRQVVATPSTNQAQQQHNADNPVAANARRVRAAMERARQENRVNGVQNSTATGIGR